MLWHCGLMNRQPPALISPVRDAAGRFPLDHPFAERPPRLHFAVTNHCNRACPWCSTFAGPQRQTYLSPAQFDALLPHDGPFQVQLEGGEPTLHPQLWQIVERARAHPRCERLVLCTNGVALPRQAERLRPWLERLGAPLTVKLSVNHHLLEHDRGLLALAQLLGELLRSLQAADHQPRELIVNVRLRHGSPDNDSWVLRAVEQAELGIYANCFYLQRYGLAARDPAAAEWNLPSAAASVIELYGPDGVAHGADQLARSQAMELLP